MKKISLCAAAAVIVLTACSSEEEEPVELHVAAAADLYHAFTALGEEFEAVHDTELTFSFGSTGQMTQQIEEGADFDVFAAAHESYIDRLLASEDVLPDSKALYALGRIGFLYDPEEYEEMTPELLASEEVQQIAIANPGHAPYGQAALEALESWGMWDELEDKLVYGNNIRETLQYTESGNVDVGIVALALAMQSDFEFMLIDEEEHEALLQALAVPTRSGHPEEAQEFIDFLFSEEGQEVMEEYGFVLPKE